MTVIRTNTSEAGTGNPKLFSGFEFSGRELKEKELFSKSMILKVQSIVEKGASKEKIGLRGPMPPGVLFAVYDSETGIPEYIPPEYTDNSGSVG